HHSKREKEEIWTVQPQGKHAKRKGHKGGGTGSDWQGQPEREAQSHRQSGRNIGAYPHQGDMSKIEQAEVHHYSEAHRQDQILKNRRGHVDLVEIVRDNRDEACSRRQQQEAGDGPHLASPGHDLTSPVGLTRSKTTMAPKPRKSTVAAEKNIGPMLSSSPSKAPPATAPGRLPMPPIITIMKAFTSGCPPMVGVT